MDNPVAEHALRTATAIINVYRRLKIAMERAAGMNLTSFQLLKSISKHPNFSNRQHVQDCRFCESINTSYNFRVLSEKGLIEVARPHGALDGRVSYYSVTEAGKRKLEEIDGRISDVIATEFKGEDIELLRHLITALPKQ